MKLNDMEAIELIQSHNLTLDRRPLYLRTTYCLIIINLIFSPSRHGTRPITSIWPNMGPNQNQVIKLVVAFIILSAGHIVFAPSIAAAAAWYYHNWSHFSELAAYFFKLLSTLKSTLIFMLYSLKMHFLRKFLKIVNFSRNRKL